MRRYISVKIEFETGVWSNGGKTGEYIIIVHENKGQEQNQRQTKTKQRHWTAQRKSEEQSRIDGEL